MDTISPATLTPEDKDHDLHGQPTELPAAEYMELKHTLHRKLLERINLERLAEIDAPRVRREVRVAVAAMVSEVAPDLAPRLKENLIDQVLNEVFGLGPLEPLMQDPSVSDILVTTPHLVYAERNGKLVKTQVRFKDNAHLQRIIQKIVGQAGRRIDESSPMVDARLPDGSRVNAVIAPIAVDGPLLSIRRFSKEPMLAEDLVRSGALTREMMDLLAACVRSRLNILVVGGTGAGKTTLLNVLSAFIPEDERIITIEDTAELQLRQEHVARMETRPPNIEGEGAIKQRQLVINSLRMRPNRIVVGEVRGEEALDMLQAMNTGHDGSLATIHANSCRDAVSRLEMMVALGNSNISVHSIQQQISAAVHLFVQVARLSDGTRRIRQIAETVGMKDGEIELQELFVFENLGVAADGSVQGRHRATGVKPRFLDKLRRSGEKIPDQLFEPPVEV
jgi:pilus assembly protein CpaF